MRNPEAVFDSLVIVKALDETLRGVSRFELQKLTFLACILSLYRGLPASDWGYRFARTGYGTPFSAGVNSAVDFLLSAGHLAEQGGRLSASESGRHLLEALSHLTTCVHRGEFLAAAAASALAVPPGVIAHGIEKEPSVVQSAIRVNGASLLEGAALDRLYEHFSILSQVLPPSAGGLIAPSVLWLTSLADEPISQRIEAQS